MSKFKITDLLLAEVQKLYPGCEVFKSLEPDYICVRKTRGSSKFYKTIEEVKPNKQVVQKDIPFTVDITIVEKIHVAEAMILTKVVIDYL